MRKTFILLSILYLLLSSCSSEKLSPEKTEEKIEFLSDDKVRDYIKTQAFAVTPEKPQQRFNLEVIPEDDIKPTISKFWQYWKETHSDMSSQMGFNEITLEKDIVCHLPQNEQMRMIRFFKGTKPNEGFPLIINLHGGGRYPSAETAWGSDINSDEWSTLLDFTGIQNKYGDDPSCFIVPRMADDRKGRWYFTPQIYIFKKLAQLAMMNENFNSERIYLTGISEGGYGTNRLALFMPDYFAAFGVLAAAERPDGSEVNLRNVAFRMEVGASDYAYGRSTYAYKWQDRMRELRENNQGDFEHSVIIQVDRGHYIRYFNALPWMKKHSRKITPDRVTYVYANIAPDYNDENGKFSDGVYFLDFRELKADSKKARMLFDVRKDKNVYYINTTPLHEGVKGKLSIFLDSINTQQPVEIRLNGKVVYNKIVPATRGAIIESIVLYGDPRRIYSRMVTVEL